ncbi:hypothetical protein FRC02_009991 [Tulasnella sp. 418]|nr:hypothetical protein FRC02_009991 [Tulasnella sp. 418]
MNNNFVPSDSNDAETSSSHQASPPNTNTTVSDTAVAGVTHDVNVQLHGPPTTTLAAPPTFVPSQTSLPSMTNQPPHSTTANTQRSEGNRPIRMVSLTGYEGPFYYLPHGLTPVGDAGVIKKLPPQKGKKSYLCPGCDLVFDRLSALRQHCLSHTGERPHQCAQCERRFSVASNLRRHLRTCKGPRPASEAREGESQPLESSSRKPRSRSVDEETEGNVPYQGGSGQGEMPRRRSYSPSHGAAHSFSPDFPPQIILPSVNPFFASDNHLMTTLSSSTTSSPSPWLDTPQDVQDSHYFGHRVAVTSPPPQIQHTQTSASEVHGIFDPRFHSHTHQSYPQTDIHSYAPLPSQDQHQRLQVTPSGPHHHNPLNPSSNEMHLRDYPPFYYDCPDRHQSSGGR